MTGNTDVDASKLSNVEVIPYKTLAATEVEEDHEVLLEPPTAQDVAIIM